MLGQILTLNPEPCQWHDPSKFSGHLVSTCSCRSEASGLHLARTELTAWSLEPMVGRVNMHQCGVYVIYNVQWDLGGIGNRLYEIMAWKGRSEWRCWNSIRKTGRWCHGSHTRWSMVQLKDMDGSLKDLEGNPMHVIATELETLTLTRWEYDLFLLSFSPQVDHIVSTKWFSRWWICVATSLDKCMEAKL